MCMNSGHDACRLATAKCGEVGFWCCTLTPTLSQREKENFKAHLQHLLRHLPQAFHLLAQHFDLLFECLAINTHAFKNLPAR